MYNCYSVIKFGSVENIKKFSEELELSGLKVDLKLNEDGSQIIRLQVDLGDGTSLEDEDATLEQSLLSGAISSPEQAKFIAGILDMIKVEYTVEVYKDGVDEPVEIFEHSDDIIV